MDAPALPQALHQLPPETAEFTGRETEAAELLGLFEPSPRGSVMRFAALSGKPGVGKSALAIHVAHRLATRLSDAQLYVDLRAADAKPLDPSEVLADFLRALGVHGDALPRSLDERAKSFRSQLSGKRAVVVLDNAVDERQVRPLLPGSPSCALLITSRSPLGALEGAHLLSVDVIGRSAAIELLGRLAGAPRVAAEPRVAGEIARLCGDLPLAVRIAGGLLAEQRALTLSVLRERLNRGVLDALSVGDREVRGSLALSYAQLRTEEARLFRRLGALTGPDFGVRLAAVLDHASPEDAETRLERLVHAQLLDAPAAGRYRFHDLLRVFARERLDADEPDQAATVGDQALDWYYEEAGLADAVLGAVSPELRTALEKLNIDVDVTRVMALDRLTVERANLVAAVEQAYQAHEWQRVIRLAGALSRFYSILGHWEEWRHTQSLAVRAASKSGDRAEEAGALMELGNAYGPLGRWRDAVESYERALGICRGLKLREREAQSLVNLGRAYVQLGRAKEAADCYEQSLAHFREQGDRLGAAGTLSNLGALYGRQGRYDEAITCFEQALPTLRDLGDRRAEAQTLGNAGRAYAGQHRWEKAFECYEQSLSTLTELGDRHGCALAQMNLGHAYTDLQRWPEAIASYEQSVRLLRELADHATEAEILIELAGAYDGAGRPEAIDCHLRTVAICRELDRRDQQAVALLNLADAYSRQRRLDEAIGAYESSATMFSEQSDQRGEARALFGMGNAQARRSNWPNAIASFERSIGLHRQLSDQRGEARALNSLGLVYATQQRWGEAIGCYAQSLALYPEVPDLHGEAQTRNNLARVYVHQRRWRNAIACYELELALRRKAGDRRGEALTRLDLATVFESTRMFDRQRAELATALALLRQIGAPEAEAVHARLESARGRRRSRWRP